MRLNELSDNPGATKDRIRVGRGIGSGKGKTGGRALTSQTESSGLSSLSQRLTARLKRVSLI